MALTLSVETAAENPPVEPDEIERIVAPLMEGTIEVVLADPGLMRVLNRRFRHVDHATDVLTFDLSEPGGETPEGVIYVDVRLCPPLEELLERVFHGYLHLCGWTHDDEDSARGMSARVASMVAAGLEGAC